MRRAVRLLLPLILLAAPALSAQRLEVTPAVPSALVGDEVKLDVRVELLPGQELLDLVPRNIIPPPSGTRVLAVDTLREVAKHHYEGQITIAWFRVGPQPVPTFSLLYRPEPNGLPDTLVHQPVAMQIGSILPAGNPSLKDIKPLLMIHGPVWAPLAFLGALVLAGFGWLRWRTWPKDRPAQEAEPEVALDPGPFARALTRLDQLEAAALASGNGAVPLYGDVALVLRHCLIEIGALPHEGLTTPEAVTTLPTALDTGGARARLLAVLGEADLVKFAAVRPDLPAAREHLTRARALLAAWHETAQRPAPSAEPDR